MLKVKSISFLTGLVFILAAVAITSAQCVTCHDFDTQNGGWTASPNPAICGPDCSIYKDKACEPNCSPTVSVNFEDSLNPGLLVEQRKGRLLVKTVIPDSPAAEAGLRRGDEILSVNGIAPGRSCVFSTWSSRDLASISKVTVERDRRKLQVQLKLLPVYELARNLWLGTPSAASKGGRYSLGLALESGDGYFRVTGLLQGGPAAKSGLIVGDRIVSINSHQVSEAQAFDSLKPADGRFGVILGVIRNGAVRAISVDSVSLVDALSGVSESAMQSETARLHPVPLDNSAD
jgi:predicted metalloprotease with PDZ domain